MHLARHSQHRRYILDHPDRLLDIVSELLRYFAVATGLVRRARNDVEFLSIQFKAGDTILLTPHLARTEIIIALEEWMRRIPEFGIQPGKPISALAGQVMGMEELPLSW